MVEQKAPRTACGDKYHACNRNATVLFRSWHGERIHRILDKQQFVWRATKASLCSLQNRQNLSNSFDPPSRPLPFTLVPLTAALTVASPAPRTDPFWYQAVRAQRLYRQRGCQLHRSYSATDFEHEGHSWNLYKIVTLSLPWGQPRLLDKEMEATELTWLE